MRVWGCSCWGGGRSGYCVNRDAFELQYEGRFYVHRVVDLMKTAKVMHTSCIYLERLNFYLYMQPKIISKCIILMTSKRQRHIYISDTRNMVEISHLWTKSLSER